MNQTTKPIIGTSTREKGKKVKIVWKQIKLFEPRMWLMSRIGWQITQEYQVWLNREIELVYKKDIWLKKNSKFREAMAESHHNNSLAFSARNPLSCVVDLDNINL